MPVNGDSNGCLLFVNDDRHSDVIKLTESDIIFMRGGNRPEALGGDPTLMDHIDTRNVPDTE